MDGSFIFNDELYSRLNCSLQAGMSLECRERAGVPTGTPFVLDLRCVKETCPMMSFYCTIITNNMLFYRLSLQLTMTPSWSPVLPGVQCKMSTSYYAGKQFFILLGCLGWILRIRLRGTVDNWLVDLKESIIAPSFGQLPFIAHQRDLQACFSLLNLG